MDSGRTSSTWRADAPAKLNLFLEVIGKRDDGYHEIETLMVATSIYDTLYFTEKQDGAVDVTSHWANGIRAATGCQRDPPALLEQVPAGQQNTVWRALDLFRRRAGVESGASIRLIKRIPSSAGLGGASSDAAAALVTANRAWRVGWSHDRLTDIGAQVGSDIPFFLTPSNSCCVARCRGRGEHVSLLPGGRGLEFVVVHPPLGLSTAKVFGCCRPASQPVSAGALASALRCGDRYAIGRRLFNRLQSAAAGISPWIDRLHRHFQRLDLVGFQMSGSGSSFFGVCRHRRHARRAAALLRSAGLGRVFTTSSVSSHCRLAAVST